RLKMYRRLKGQELLVYQEEVFLSPDYSIYPTFLIYDGYLDDEDGDIVLFAFFMDYEDSSKYYATIYVNGWNSENDKYLNTKNIKTIKDVIALEWLDVNIDVYNLNEIDDYNRVRYAYMKGGVAI
ncbi:MAG: hypothetical protein ACP5JU_03640, partial [Minisyncoccia bacterium]